MQKGHPWKHRLEANRDFDYDDFVYAWLNNLEEFDPSNPVLAINNGWGSHHMSNKWWADEMFPQLATFAYDSRGQGESINEGDLDSIQAAIDANYLISPQFDRIDKMAQDQGKEPGNKILQGNCIGAMTVSALFAGKFDIARQADASILISPVSTFDLPLPIKATYFLPKWLANFTVKYLAEPVAKMVVTGDDSENSRREALHRINKLDIDAALRQVKQIFWRENVEKLWHTIKVPTLLLVAEGDPLTKIEQSATVFDHLSYPIWMELEAPDHLILEDNIDFLKELIPEFARDPWAVYDEYKHIQPEYERL